MTLKDFGGFISSHTQWKRLGYSIALLCVAVGLITGFSIASNRASDSAGDDYNKRRNIFDTWQTTLSSRFTRASSLSASLAALASGSATVPANMSLPAAQRMRNVSSPEVYNRVCRGLMRDVPGITTLSLAPGGVISQSYSIRTVSLGFDLSAQAVYKPVWKKMSEDGLPAVTGPNPLTSRAGIAVYGWYPIFVSDTVGPSTLWGAAVTVMEIADILAGVNMSTLYSIDRMHYVMWYESANVSAKVVASSENTTALQTKVMAEGMRMQLPIGEPGKSSYLAMYPVDGIVSSAMSGGVIAGTIVGTLLGTLLVLAVFCAVLYAYFCHRHRFAPSTAGVVFMGVFTLRGAQPFVERAPLEAARMTADFMKAVHEEAVAHGCYPVCEVGDRSLYVVSSDAGALLSLAQKCVADVSIVGNMGNAKHNASGRPYEASEPSTHHRRSLTSSKEKRPPTATQVVTVGSAIATHVSELASESSFLSTVVCYPSVACHAVAGMERLYDASRDVYFYTAGTSLTKLCGALDQTRSGEIAWTELLQKAASRECFAATTASIASHKVSVGDAVLQVASWWKETGDERDNEDPSTAIALLNDNYVKRMTAHMSRGRSAQKTTKKGGPASATGGPNYKDAAGEGSDTSSDATLLVRSATLLHIGVGGGDMRSALGVIRRVVADERGIVVSAHSSTIVAAFNLLSSSGHHQLHAADAVARLRAALPSNSFVCSLHHGKVSALVVDGLVMCYGEAVITGSQLLQRAMTLHGPFQQQRKESIVSRTDDDTPTAVTPFEGEVTDDSPISGLCLLYCASEVVSAYDCEAVDAVPPRVLYRLAKRRESQEHAEEWMYLLKNDEEVSSFVAVNNMFTHIAEGNVEEAKRLWLLHAKRQRGNEEHTAQTSIAETRLRELLDPRAAKDAAANRSGWVL